MIKRNAGKILVGNAVAICIMAAVILLAGHFQAQAQGQAKKASSSKDSLKIGTYDANQAFQEHPAQAKMKEATQKAQSDMQKAQQEGNRQRMQQIQQEYTQTREQIRQEFEQEISEVMPEVAQKTGVEAVAQEVVYTADDVDTKDVTSKLINSFDKGEKKSPQAQPRKQRQQKRSKKEMPGFPQ